MKFDRILVIAPHPDDEILGLGGLMLKMLNQGTKIHVVYLSDGENSDIWSDKEEIRYQRIILSENICSNLGITKFNITRLHLPDGAIPFPEQPGFDDSVKILSGAINSVKPDAVFATHYRDYWPFDHVACSKLASFAIKQSKHKCQLWYYWVWAWYNLRPWSIESYNFKNLIKVNISKELPMKIRLIEMYLNALSPNGKPWSGILPESFKKAVTKPVEVIEKIA